MQNGKIMTRQHIIGEKAVKYIENEILPSEWVVRVMQPDYGIDLDVELFDFENGKCLTLGEHLFLQVKGTERPQYGKFNINKNNIKVVKFQLEIEELNLVERMGSAFPVLLVLVDLTKNTAFHICLNDYIKKVLPLQKADYKKQKTIMINIPVKNQLSKDSLNVLRWYGKRTKIYSMFHEMLADIDDFSYVDNEELVNCGKKFVIYYREYDVLKDKNSWDGLKTIKDKLDWLYENDYTFPEMLSFVQMAVGNSEDLKESKVIDGPEFFNEDAEINAYLCAQKYSVRRLSEMIKYFSGAFEVYCREFFMPGLILGVRE